MYVLHRGMMPFTISKMKYVWVFYFHTRNAGRDLKPFLDPWRRRCAGNLKRFETFKAQQKAHERSTTGSTKGTVSSENIWFSGSKPSNYQETIKCHALDGRTDERRNRKWKIGQYSGTPETAIAIINKSYIFICNLYWWQSQGNFTVGSCNSFSRSLLRYQYASFFI